MGLKIHRSRHAQEYVVVPNSAARDARLSFTARGLHHYLLSLPPEWTFTVAQLAKWNPDGRQALRVAMRELREWGYVVLISERGKRGRMTSHYEVYDVPPDAARPASGPTCEDSASPQVAPDAAPPASGERSSIPKYGNPARARPASRRGARAKPPDADRQPPVAAARCSRCGSDRHERSECDS